MSVPHHGRTELRPYFVPAGAAAAAGAAALSDLAAWPLNVRVGANSPSLWPTMFSVTYTGMNLRPLWTAMVWPTISGKIVERRDQVRTTFLSLVWFMTVIFDCRCSSMNGPFFAERAIFSYSKILSAG